MTEADWMGSTDPQAMMRFIIPHHVNDRVGGQFPSSQFSATDRKLRLFATACCRVIWDRLTDPRSRDAVETAERYADGEATKEELQSARTAAVSATDYYTPLVTDWFPPSSAAWCAAPELPRELGNVQRRFPVPPATQCHILRDLFAPFRPVRLPYFSRDGKSSVQYRIGDPVVLHEGAYCPWTTPTVLELARAAYASGNPLDPAALAVLADALESEGCQDQDMLTHLRGNQRCQTCKGFRYITAPDNDWDEAECWECKATGYRPRPTPCYRGCHCLDALLGKE